MKMKMIKQINHKCLGCLRKTPMTEENYEEKIISIDTKVRQNGQIRLSITVTLFSKMDNNMAASILNGIRIRPLLNENTGLYKHLLYEVRCRMDDNGTFCDATCLENHPSPLDHLNNIGKNEVNNCLTMVKNISRMANIYVKNLIKNNCQHYDLWIDVDDENNVVLRGNIWPQKFENLNKKLSRQSIDQMTLEEKVLF